MSFRLKNIMGHLPSTKVGVLVLVGAVMFFVWKGKATWEEVTAFVVPVGALLTYGKSETPKQQP
jgi:hypothetical protein